MMGADRGEPFRVRVHQMMMNEGGRGEAFEEAFPGRITGENDDTDWSDPAGFLLPGFSFYGILCKERNGSQGIPSSKPKRVLLLFCCF